MATFSFRQAMIHSSYSETFSVVCLLNGILQQEHMFIQHS